MFLQRTHVRNLIAAVANGHETERFAMLWLAAYVFLLRVPSEALPMMRGESCELTDGHAVLFLEVSSFEPGARSPHMLSALGCQHSVFKAEEP